MGLTAAAGGVVAGIVVQHWGYAWLAHIALTGAAAIMILAAMALSAERGAGAGRTVD